MAFTTTVCTSFKAELGRALHDFTAGTGSVFKIALYSTVSGMGATTTVYSATNEVTGSGYTAGGKTLTNVTPVTSGTTAIYDFDDAVWLSSTITAIGALIYNSTNGNRAVLVLGFGANEASVSGAFTIVFPTPDASNAVLRITAS